MSVSFHQVTLVRWNEPYQKLASCDTSGIIFVWIKYEGRWSIELINDRSTPVICFSWSHDGRMALICYQVTHTYVIIRARIEGNPAGCVACFTRARTRTCSCSAGSRVIGDGRTDATQT